MSEFKLLAIRPLAGCGDKFLKNLQKGEIYKFYNDFDFVLDEKNIDVIEIEDKSTLPVALFGENINVSAIVGKNGSGKSTIIELFSLIVFCISVELDLINIEKFKKDHSLNQEEIKRLENELKSFNELSFELYFYIDGNVYNIKKVQDSYTVTTFSNLSIEDSISDVFKIHGKDNLREIKNNKKSEFLRDAFFYSILANYSIYGLNTNETGIWLKSIFHKNDGYQTPIVLNPMRTEGIIDINRLTYLSKSRLLSNVFQKLENNQKAEESLRNLVNNKIVNKIVLKLDLSKFNLVEIDQLKPNQNALNLLSINNQNIYLDFSEKYKKTHFLLLLKSFYPNILVANLNLNQNSIQKLTIEYILKKVYDVFSKYPQFKGFRSRVFRSNFVEKNVIQCFDILSEDFSHSTFKIRQALNFLVYNFYQFNNETEKVFLLSNNENNGIADIINNNRNLFLHRDLEALKKNDELIADFDVNAEYLYYYHSLINYLPPSFFEIDFEFIEKGFFKDLSSGEKQMIYSINSIIYHISNLNSIFSVDSNDRIIYRNHNIILDEIELYFHPEFQRIYIYELLKSINFIKTPANKFNIIFLTHSPFILSDIPNQNILRIEDGYPKNYSDTDKTFGANIHSLLANDFFMDKGFMGELAKNRLEETISYLNFKTAEKRLEEIDSKNNIEEFKSLTLRVKELKKQTFSNDKNFHEKVISIIGEPIIKHKLQKMFYEIFDDEHKNNVKAELLELANKAGIKINF